MVRKWLYLAMLVLLVAPVACAPKQAAVTSAPVPQQAAPAAAVAASRSPEEAAWTRVVEAAKKEGKVTIYSYKMIGDTSSAISRAFKEKYGISVDIVSGRGSELVEKILTEQRVGQATADLMESGPTTLYTLKDAKLTVSSADIPVLQEKDVWLVDPRVSDETGHILVNSLNSYFGAVINTRLVKAGDEPKSLRDLTQPKWAGKMTTYDTTVSAAGYNFFYTILRRKFTDQETMRAFGRNNVKFAVNLASGSTDVARGDFAMFVGAADSLFARSAAEGAPVKAIAFEEGTVVAGSAIAAVKAPHPNTAKLFINWLLTPEGQNMFLKDLHVASPRKDAPDFRLEALRVPAGRLIATTHEDDVEINRAFTDKFLPKLWKD